MESSSSYRRAEAVKQLGRMEELRLSDLPLIVHTKLENALFEIALPLLEPLINDQAQSVRSNVISAFSYIQKRPSSGVINLLISYLKDPSEEVRDRCARSLGRMNIEEAINEILRLAKHDPSPVVRAGAVAALGMMKSDDVDNLSSLFQRLFDSETSKMVKETISETLVLITNIPKKD
jgi:HEAT repeat protein